MAEEKMPLDRLARIYMKMRSAKDQIKKEYDTKLEELEEQMKTVSHEMKDQLMAAGVKSVRTDNGTIMLGQKTRYWTQDWDEFKKFVVQNNALDLFEKRIAQSNMAKFLEDNPGTLPPGLNAESEYTISVRKPT